MGAASKEEEKVEEQKIPNGNEAKETEKKQEDISTEVSKENAGGCCQGVNGFTCCRDGSTDTTEEKKTNKTKELGKFSCWMGSYEPKEILAGAAVIGVVSIIAFAYYRRSG